MPARARRARGASVVGRRFRTTIGPVAHGGHCVARVETAPGETRVVFVRHALPGEEVVVEITEGTEGDRFWRGDAVSVEDPSPDRVVPPCPAAGPGRCGGCDFQHVDLAAQRALKATVVREQLVRLGGFAADEPLVAGLVVEAVSETGETGQGLRWRTRTAFAATPEGRPGLRRHRSRDVIPLADCPITAEDALVTGPVPPDLVAAGRVRPVMPGETVTEPVAAAGSRHEYAVAADGFWQVHPQAPRVLVETVLEMLAPQPGESVLDLYAGVGLFASFLADRVAPGAVVAVEGNRLACERARQNLAGRADVVHGPVDRVLARLDEPVDLVVLDPPREGARRTVVDQVVARRPRAAAYVACDPAALARDLATFREHGYRLSAVRAFDLFPMTSHVECVTLLER